MDEARVLLTGSARLPGCCLLVIRIESSYADARKSGADQAALATIASEYAAAVIEVASLSGELMNKIGPACDSVEIILAAMSMVYPDQLTAAEQEDLEKLLEPVSQHLEPLREASRAIVPVMSEARTQFITRMQLGEKPTPELEKEVIGQAAKTVLQDKKAGDSDQQ